MAAGSAACGRAEVEVAACELPGQALKSFREQGDGEDRPGITGPRIGKRPGRR